jgi:hypothetical protein
MHPTIVGQCAIAQTRLRYWVPGLGSAKGLVAAMYLNDAGAEPC